MNSCIPYFLIHNNTAVYLNTQECETSIFGLMCSIFATIFCLVGLPGNLISARVFWLFNRSKRSPINVLLFSLSLVDFCLLLFSAPVMILPSFNAHMNVDWMHTFYPLALTVCYPLSMITQTCSMYTFVLITLERYVAVCRPFQARNVCTVKRTKRAQAAVILLATLYNAVRFFEYSLHTEAPEGYERVLRNDYGYFILYHIALHFVTHFMLPFAVIGALGVNIVKVTMSKTVSCGVAFLIRRQEAQRKTTHMIISVIAMVIFCNTMPMILNLWEVFDFDVFQGPNEQVAYALVDVSNALVFLNSSTTFAFYWIFCRRYRMTCKRLFRFKRRKCEKRLLKRGAYKCYSPPAAKNGNCMNAKTQRRWIRYSKLSTDV